VSRSVLIINLEFPPIGGPGVQRVLKFIRYLPEEGWTPTVICGEKSTWHNLRDNTLVEEVPANVAVFRVSFSTIADYTELASAMVCNLLSPLHRFFPKEEMQKNVQLRLCNLFHYIHPEPLLSWVFLGTRKAMECHKKRHFDVVMTSGPPHITHMVGLMLKQLYRVKWVADFRDPWVDSLIQADRLGISRRLDRLWERLVLKNADRVISVSPRWTKLLAQKLKHPEKTKVSVIYNGYDPNDVPDDTSEPTARGHASRSLHIHYNGSIQGAMLPHFFFKALAELKKEEPDIHRSLKCTFTGLPTSVANLADDFRLDQVVRDVGHVSHRESLRISLSSDVLLLIVNQADETVRGLMTGKVYEYIAMGKSILAIIPQGGDLHALLRDCPQSFIVKPNDLRGIIEKLKLLMSKKRNGELNAFKSPNWITQYTRQAQTRRLAEMLEDLRQDGARATLPM
jgi:glycosyltransferase involved in cell wall biosynthesis